VKYVASAILVISALWAVNYYTDFDFSSMSSQHDDMQNSALIKAGEECVAISEQATAHMVPRVEFQKLELAGRKANVVVRCMQDRNFVQNPAWLSYAQPLASKNASAQNISQDEALENLKRADMLKFAAVPEHPSYWLQIKSAQR